MSPTPGAHRVRAFLHKPSLEQMRAGGALDSQGRVAIDTGLVWLDHAALERVLPLGSVLAPALAAGMTLNLYGDLLAPLAEQAIQASYLADQSDGAATPALQRARQQIWDSLRGLPFSVERLHPAAFIHFGTTLEYLQFLQDGVSILGPCGWDACAASWAPASQRANGPSGSAAPGDDSPCRCVAVNASLSMSAPRERPSGVNEHPVPQVAKLASPAMGSMSAPQQRPSAMNEHPVPQVAKLASPVMTSAGSAQAGPAALGAFLLDTRLDASWYVEGPTGGILLSHVVTEREALTLREGVVLDQLPLQDAPGDAWVTRLYGVADDPKRTVAEGGTFLGRPWAAWLADAGLAFTDLWPDASDPAACTLWEARLYPPCADREASLDAVLWLQDPAKAAGQHAEALATAQGIAAWRAAPRLSLAQSYVRADVGRLVREQGEIEDTVRAHRFYDGLERQRPAATLAPILGQPQDSARRARLVADWLEASIDPWLPMRGYRALAVATGDRRWEERAFSSLARLVRAHTPSVAASENLRRLLDMYSGHPARPSGPAQGRPLPLCTASLRLAHPALRKVPPLPLCTAGILPALPGS